MIFTERRMKKRWFIPAVLAGSAVIFLLSAVSYNGGAVGRYQIAGTDKIIYILDTFTGEVRFCGLSGDVVSFKPFSETQRVKYREDGYCGEGCCEEHGKYESGK